MSIFNKLTEVKDTVVCDVTSGSHFLFNASNLEVLKLRRDYLHSEFEKKKQLNDTYKKVVHDKLHLEQLILYISAEKTHYDLRISDVVFSSAEDSIKIKQDYKTIMDALGVLNTTLQGVYEKLNHLSEMSDEKLEMERIAYESALQELNDRVKNTRDKKKSAGNQFINANAVINNKKIDNNLKEFEFLPDDSVRSQELYVNHENNDDAEYDVEKHSDSNIYSAYLSSLMHSSVVDTPAPVRQTTDADYDATRL